MIADPVLTPVRVTCELYDETAGASLGVLEDADQVRWLVELNAAGSGSLRVPLGVPGVLVPAVDQVVVCKVDGTPVHAWSVAEVVEDAVGDPGQRWAACSGPGLLAWLADAVVLARPDVDLDDPYRQGYPAARSTGWVGWGWDDWRWADTEPGGYDDVTLSQYVTGPAADVWASWKGLAHEETPPPGAHWLTASTPLWVAEAAFVAAPLVWSRDRAVVVAAAVGQLEVAVDGRVVGGGSGTSVGVTEMPAGVGIDHVTARFHPPDDGGGGFLLGWGLKRAHPDKDPTLLLQTLGMPAGGPP